MASQPSDCVRAPQGAVDDDIYQRALALRDRVIETLDTADDLYARPVPDGTLPSPQLGIALEIRGAVYRLHLQAKPIEVIDGE